VLGQSFVIAEGGSSDLDDGFGSLGVVPEHFRSLDTADRVCKALDLILVSRPGSTLALDLVREREK